jgi:hypothetical protein
MTVSLNRLLSLKRSKGLGLFVVLFIEIIYSLSLSPSVPPPWRRQLKPLMCEQIIKWRLHNDVITIGEAAAWGGCEERLGQRRLGGRPMFGPIRKRVGRPQALIYTTADLRSVGKFGQ